MADATEMKSLFDGLTTAHAADACLRLRVDVRCAPCDVLPLRVPDRLAGRVRPARHYGSVDIFLEALEASAPGDVLVIDNSGRRDEACVGDLVVLETKLAGLAGMVVWGLHRDTRELDDIGLPVFSQGRCPTGPQRLDARDADALVSARVGSWTVGVEDFVIGDADGVLFVPVSRAEEIARTARSIRDTERFQSQKMRRDVSLRTQLRFSDFLARRASNPALALRDHLRAIGGAIEE